MGPAIVWATSLFYFACGFHRLVWPWVLLGEGTIRVADVRGSLPPYRVETLTREVVSGALARVREDRYSTGLFDVDVYTIVREAFMTRSIRAGLPSGCLEGCPCPVMEAAVSAGM